MVEMRLNDIEKEGLGDLGIIILTIVGGNWSLQEGASLGKYSSEKAGALQPFVTSDESISEAPAWGNRNLSLTGRAVRRGLERGLGLVRKGAFKIKRALPEKTREDVNPR